MKFINYIFLVAFFISITPYTTARMSGPAIGRAIQTLTKKYIPEAQQKDFTQTEYDQWFEKTNTLYNNLKASKPEATTRGKPSIQELFEKVVRKQTNQLKQAIEKIPNLEQIEAITHTVDQQIEKAPEIIHDELKEFQEALTQEVQKAHEVEEKIVERIDVISSTVKKEEQLDLQEQQEYKDMIKNLEIEGKKRLEQKLQAAKAAREKKQIAELQESYEYVGEFFEHIEKELEKNIKQELAKEKSEKEKITQANLKTIKPLIDEYKKAIKNNVKIDLAFHKLTNFLPNYIKEIKDKIRFLELQYNKDTHEITMDQSVDLNVVQATILGIHDKINSVIEPYATKRQKSQYLNSMLEPALDAIDTMRYELAAKIINKFSVLINKVHAENKISQYDSQQDAKQKFSVQKELLITLKIMLEQISGINNPIKSTFMEEYFPKDYLPYSIKLFFDTYYKSFILPSKTYVEKYGNEFIQDQINEVIDVLNALIKTFKEWKLIDIDEYKFI